jgi:hypothetical protein
MEATVAAEMAELTNRRREISDRFVIPISKLRCALAGMGGSRFLKQDGACVAASACITAFVLSFAVSFCQFLFALLDSAGNAHRAWQPGPERSSRDKACQAAVFSRPAMGTIRPS